MAYINPVPHIDEGKEFEFRVRATFPELVTVEEGKLATARYLKDLSDEELAEKIVCLKIQAMYE